MCKTLYSIKKIILIERIAKHGGQPVKVIKMLMLNSKRNVTTWLK